MSGGQSLSLISALYDYAGGLRNQLNGLIDAVQARDAKPVKKRKRFLGL